MKYIISSRLIFCSLAILTFQIPMLGVWPPCIQKLGIKPRDIYIAGSAVIGTAAIVIPTCLIWSNNHHPAALAQKQLEIQTEQQRTQEKKQKILKSKKSSLRHKN